MALNGCLLLGSLQICGSRSLGLSVSQAWGLGKPGQDSGPQAPVRWGQKHPWQGAWAIPSLSPLKPLNLRAVERAQALKTAGSGMGPGSVTSALRHSAQTGELSEPWFLHRSNGKK